MFQSQQNIDLTYVKVITEKMCYYFYYYYYYYFILFLFLQEKILDFTKKRLIFAPKTF